MTVETLIKILEKQDPKSPVFITQAGFGHDKVKTIRTEKLFSKKRESLVLYLRNDVVTYGGQKVVYRKKKSKAELVKPN
jgi:hypothetical protein